MADLKALFDENGLLGIIPYAFNMSGQGYDFLCLKLKAGVPFWTVYSDENLVPFIATDTERNYIYFPLFSTQEQADDFVQTLLQDNLRFHPQLVYTGSNADNLWLCYRDLGITHVRFDDTIWVDIKDLAPTATYDGFLNLKLPIRNAALNASLYYMLEYMDAGINFDESIACFWKVLQASYFYVPLRPRTALRKGEAITSENSDFHYKDNPESHKIKESILAFTDKNFLEMYAAIEHLKPEDYTAAYTPSFADLKEFMKLHPDYSIMLNTYAGSLILTLEFFEEMETIALNIDAGKAGLNT